MRVGSIMHSSNMEKSGKSDLIVTDKLKEIYNKSGRNDLQYLRDHMADTYLQAIWKVPDFFSITKWKRNEPLKNSYYFKTKISNNLFSCKEYAGNLFLKRKLRIKAGQAKALASNVLSEILQDIGLRQFNHQIILLC